VILVDTSVWIDFFGGTASEEKDAMRKFIINQKQVTLTGIILTEILQVFYSRLYDEMNKFSYAWFC
jgi:predicted nucleic acid-binding protein